MTADHTSRLPALDGLRGLAAFLVMMLHFTMQLPPSAEPGIGILVRAFSFGWTGVDLFFVLSGFLITGILFDAKGSSNYFTVFYARRMLRILPLYYLALAILFFVPPLFGEVGGRFVTPVRDQLWYWLYLQNFHQLSPLFTGLSGHLWSLAIEEQFYLLWPFVILLLSRRDALRTCVACVVVSIVWRSVGTFGPYVLDTYYTTPARLDSLAVGSAIALIARGDGGLERIKKYALPSTLLAIAVIAVYYGSSRLDLPAASKALFPLLYTAFAMVYGSLLLRTVRQSQSGEGSFPGWKPLRVLGRYSYGLYVVHVPLISAMYYIGVHPARTNRGASSALLVASGYIILMFAVSIAVAAVSWHLYEKRFLVLKNRFVYHT